jgi:Domain of unknown function (DUF4384)
MSRSARRLGSGHALCAALTTAAVLFVAGPAQSQDQDQNQDQQDDASRGVRILDAPTPPPSTSAAPVVKSLDNPGPPLLTPAAPAQAPTLSPPVASVQPTPNLAPPSISDPAPILPPGPALRPIPVAPVPAPAPPPARPNSTANVGVPSPAVPTLTPAPSVPLLQPAVRPAPDEEAKPPVILPRPSDIAGLPKPDGGFSPKPAELDAIASGVKVPNTAGLAMQILPGQEITVGSEVSFQVSSKKPGYLILVDVEATGKLVQIYPNPMSLRMPGVRENLNFLKPGKPLRIPDRANAYAGFNFIASPPAGTAMVIAILSDRPVQMVDLPDIPISMLGSASAIDYLTKMAGGLRIPDRSGSGRLDEPHWSFDAKFYAIR